MSRLCTLVHKCTSVLYLHYMCISHWIIVELDWPGSVACILPRWGKLNLIRQVYHHGLRMPEGPVQIGGCCWGTEFAKHSPAPELPIPNKGVHGHRAVDLCYEFVLASCKFLSNELHLSEETCSNAIWGWMWKRIHGTTATDALWRSLFGFCPWQADKKNTAGCRIHFRQTACALSRACRSTEQAWKPRFPIKEVVKLSNTTEWSIFIS